MNKLIITHINPDPDAITSVWLLRRFDQQLQEAAVDFVPAGKTYQDQPADSNPDVVHVDTGMGEFDHHQEGRGLERTSAARLVLDYLQQKYEYLRDDEALERLVEIIIQDDHFLDCYWCEADNDRYEFIFGSILDGLKRNGTINDHGLVDLGSTCLDGIYTSMKLKVAAEKEIEEGKQFETKWGKGIAIVTKNDEVMPLAQKKGYILVVRKDPEGMVRLKAQPKSAVDFTNAYHQLKELDPEATWYLHPSKKMLLNGSYRNPDMKVSKLGLDELIEVLSQQS